MRYWLTRQGVDCAWIVELAADRQVAHELIVTGNVPRNWATMSLVESPGSGGPATYLDNPDFRIEPLPLGAVPLLSPLDFSPHRIRR